MNVERRRKAASGVTSDSSATLKQIFDSIGLTRDQVAHELGVTRDAVQRMIRGGFVPLRHIGRLKDLSTQEIDCDIEAETMRAVNFKLPKNTVLEAAKAQELKQAGLENETDREAAYRKAMFMRGDLKRFTDLQLKHELELRGWLVKEPK